jgi:flagellar biosynthetic protein FlhB
MSDQGSQNRNLPATPRKLGKARAEGQVVRSREFGHFLAIAVGGAVLVTMGSQLTDWMQQTLMQGLRFDSATIHNTGSMGERLQELTVRLLFVIVPFGGVMMGTALLGCIAIGGWNWTLQPIMPNFGKLNPIQGLAGILSMGKLIDAMKGSLLAIILGGIGALYLKNHVEEFAGLLALPLPAAVHQISTSMLGGLMLLLLALGVFAMIDVPLQRFQHAKRLKMSAQEVKQEHKEQEGNPEIKAKVKARMRELTKRRMMAAVPKADLVVMNPTHYAVALKYDDQKMGAPRVVAKGTDLLALAIRDLAKDSKVPVLQAPVLARALYAHAELDREIPAALFAAVAQVLAYVYQLRAALGGQVAMPAAMPELNVPAELDPHHTPVPDMENYE